MWARTRDVTCFNAPTSLLTTLRRTLTILQSLGIYRTQESGDIGKVRAFKSWEKVLLSFTQLLDDLSVSAMVLTGVLLPMVMGFASTATLALGSKKLTKHGAMAGIAILSAPFVGYVRQPSWLGASWLAGPLASRVTAS